MSSDTPTAKQDERCQHCGYPLWWHTPHDCKPTATGEFIPFGQKVNATLEEQQATIDDLRRQFAEVTSERDVLIEVIEEPGNVYKLPNRRTVVSYRDDYGDIYWWWNKNGNKSFLRAIDAIRDAMKGGR